MEIAIILVHYHTPILLKRCVDSICADLSSSNMEAEIILIDNGSKPEDKDLFDELGVKIINPGENLGYARGVNLGVKNTDAEIFFFMNPDLDIDTGCLEALVSVLKNGAAAVGPRFFLDKDKTILLPPLMDLTWQNELLWRMAVFGHNTAQWVRNRWRKNAKYHWEAVSLVESYCLTGALLGIRRDAWDKVGPFDERYQLYFEEADWLKRLEKTNLKSYYVPEAHAIHTYNQSAIKEPKAKKWFDESNNLYRKSHYGKFFNAFLVYLAPRMRNFFLGNSKRTADNPFPVTGLPTLDISFIKGIRNKPLWIEISDCDLKLPAAGVPIHDTLKKIWQIPKGVWDSLEPKTYNFQVVDNIGNEIYTMNFSRRIKGE